MMKKLLFIAVCVLGTFTSTIFAQTNLDLETWGTNACFVPNAQPDGWATLNSFVCVGFGQSAFKDTTTFVDGMASARLETIPAPGAVAGAGACSDTMGGMLSIGPVTPGGPIGIQYTNKPYKVDFMYKYMPMSGDTGANIPMLGDTGAIIVTLSHYDAIMDSTITDGQGWMLFTQMDTASWVAGSVIINWDSAAGTPDTLEIIASSSAVGFCTSYDTLLMGKGVGSQRIGTTLWLDAFAIDTVFPPVGINELTVESQLMNIFPNPANSSLTIHSKDPADPILLIEVYNATGQLVRRVFNVNITSRYVLKRKGLPSGLYMINVKTTKHNVTKKVIFE